MSDIVTIEERYAGAVEAHDLTMHYECIGDVDTLIAAGMVGVRNPLSMSLWRWLYGQDEHERHAVMEGLMKWMQDNAVKRHWQPSPHMAEVVMVVAGWHHNGICEACHGTRYVPIEGTPTLSDTPCPVCHGSGKQSLDRLLIDYGADWIKRGKMLSAHMDHLLSAAAGAMLAKVRNSIDDGGL